jgi:hypothetical protein
MDMDLNVDMDVGFDVDIDLNKERELISISMKYLSTARYVCLQIKNISSSFCFHQDET